MLLNASAQMGTDFEVCKTGGATNRSLHGQPRAAVAIRRLRRHGAEQAQVQGFQPAAESLINTRHHEFLQSASADRTIALPPANRIEYFLRQVLRSPDDTGAMTLFHDAIDQREVIG